jgi:hypothetical protein
MNLPSGRRKKEPHVGIFWLVGGKPIIDSTPLGEAEPYGDHLIHARSHLEVWTLFQQRSIAPRGMEYEEAPRGRVIYDIKTQRFLLLADRCILQDQNLVMKLMSEMNLPEETATDTHSHYRCAVCLHTWSH